VDEAIPNYRVGPDPEAIIDRLEAIRAKYKGRRVYYLCFR
jgi:hypothetical protein